MSMTDTILADAFHHTLQDVYFTEKLSARTLRRAARKASSAALRQTFQRQGEESASHVAQLGRVFDIIGKPARARNCPPIKGMTADMEEYLDEHGSTEAADTMLIFWAQTVKSYAIGRYGTLKDWSCKLGLQAAEGVIEETLQEASRAADLLSRVVDDLAADDVAPGFLATSREGGFASSWLS
jgi:ferritin-like metal-binding protein YciE